MFCVFIESKREIRSELKPVPRKLIPKKRKYELSPYFHLYVNTGYHIANVDYLNEKLAKIEIEN